MAYAEGLYAGLNYERQVRGEQGALTPEAGHLVISWIALASFCGSVQSLTRRDGLSRAWQVSDDEIGGQLFADARDLERQGRMGAEGLRAANAIVAARGSKSFGAISSTVTRTIIMHPDGALRKEPYGDEPSGVKNQGASIAPDHVPKPLAETEKNELWAKAVVAVLNGETGKSEPISLRDDLIASDELPRIEMAIRQWGNLVTHDSAEATLRLKLSQEPLTLLYGVSWILAMWARVVEINTNIRADDVIRGLEYSGPWLDSTEPHWQTATHIVRLGALAVLILDNEAKARFDELATTPPGAEAVTLRCALAMMDGFSQDIHKHFASPWGLTERVLMGRR